MLRQFKLNDIEDIFVTDYVANGSFQSLKENVKEVESGPVIMIRLVDFNNSWQGPFKYLDLESFKFLSKSSLEKGDIIISNVGANIGTVFRAPDLDKKMTLGPNSVVLKVSMDPEIIDKDFLYYFFSSPKGQHLLQSISGGSAQPKFNKTDLRNLIIEIPDLKIQKRFSKILLSIDKKIELNQQMNKTLEDIAKKLFKSWFIDFDPVRAKAEGRPTGLSKEISDLFPDSFEDSELGEIPKGWNLLTFGDFVTPIRGKVITKKTTNPGDIPVVAGGLKPAYFHSIANVEGPAVTISASGANAGYTNLYYEDIWASDCSYISNKQSSNVFTSYIFLKLNQERIFDSQHGAAQPHIYPDDLRRLDMVIPSNDLYETFENLITSFFNKIKLNIEETKNLISLRDTLLPKLISGELKIPDAEEIIEEARV